MSIVRTQPTPAACCAVYQTARLLHLRKRTREVLQLWESLPPFKACETTRRKSYDRDIKSLGSAANSVVPGVAPMISQHQGGGETADTSAPASVSPRTSEVDGPGAASPSPLPRESSDVPDDDKSVDIYEPIFIFCMADNEVRLICTVVFALSVFRTKAM